MNFPHSSLRAFLSTAKTSLRNAIHNHQRVNLVIGNESADLDSITSSILYAYFRSITTSKTTQPSLYIPLLNIPREDIQIRPELLHLLPHANLEPSHLITLSDLPPQNTSLSESLSPSSTTWTLVDHNALQGILGKTYSSQIVACIDHHADENKISSQASPRIITKSGSCTSLVVNHFRPVWDDLSSTALVSVVGQAQGDAAVGYDDSAVRKTWDAQIAKLALASILTDTIDLQDKGKVTEHDIQAVRHLEAKILSGPGGAKWVRKDFFDGVEAAKAHLDDLKLENVLRKDYKEWVEGEEKTVGISSCVKPLTWLAKKAMAEVGDAKDGGHESFAQGIRSFAEDRKLSAYAIMTASNSPSGDFQRELLLWVLDKDSCPDMIEAFRESSSEELSLEEWKEDGLEGPLHDQGMQIWWQKKVEKSRKQVAPLLRSAM